MMILKKKTIWEIALVIGVSITFTIVNSLHVITQWIGNAPDRVFTGIAQYVDDYFFYVDIMAQGAAGHLAALPHFTSELFPTSLIYWYNGLIGWAGHIVGLSPFASYNVTLILLVFILCLLWYVVAKLIFPTNRFARLTCFLFILSASGFIDINNFLMNKRIDLFGQFWFSPAPAFNRLGAVPHQALQTILLVLIIIYFSQLLTRLLSKHFFIRSDLSRVKSRDWSVLIGLAGLSFLASTMSPIQMLLLLSAALLATLWFAHSTRRVQLLMYMPASVLLLAAFPGFLLSYRWFLHPIFVVAKLWEASQNVNVPIISMILAIGPIVFLIPFGIISFLKNATPLRVMFFLYGLLSFIIFYSPVPKLIGSSPTRWIHPAPYAILAILGAEGITTISLLLRKFTPKFSKNLSFIIYHVSFIILYLLLTLPTLYSQIDARTNTTLHTVFTDALTSNLNHVPKPVGEALTWLKNQPDDIANSSVVLTDPSLPYDVLVPVFTEKISFTGHPVHTLYAEVKSTLRQQFFNGEMSDAEGLKFLTNHRIGYILTAPNRVLPSVPSLSITQVYKNTAVTIYKYNRDISCFSDTCPFKKR